MAAHPPSQIDALLARLDAALTAAEAALAAELDALGAGAAGDLITAVEQKRHALRSLEALAGDRHLVALLTSLPRQPRLDGLFERLRACRDRNVVAGTAISRARRTNEHLLRFLGRTPERPAYNAAGHTPSTIGGRALGVA